MEGRGEELDDFVLAVDETVVGFAEDGGFLLGGGDVGEDGPCLRNEVDLAFGVVAAADGVAVVEIGAEEPSAVPCGGLQGLGKGALELEELLQ